MALSREESKLTRPPYDWQAFRLACIQEPGVWIREDDPSRPTTNAHQIRRGTPTVFEPSGAFDAIYRRAEGTFIRYVGVPVEPWEPWLTDAPFADVLRTFDPELFPEATPRALIDLVAAYPAPKKLRKLAPFTLAELETALA